MSNNRPPLTVVPDSTQPVEVDDWEGEPTSPDAPNAVSNAALLRAIRRLEMSFTAGIDKLGKRISRLVVGIAGLAGALALVSVLLWWLK